RRAERKRIRASESIGSKPLARWGIASGNRSLNAADGPLQRGCGLTHVPPKWEARMSPRIPLIATFLLAAGSVRSSLGQVATPLRAVEVLEIIATPAARTLLATYAQGDPETILTQQARAAVARLERTTGGNM